MAEIKVTADSGGGTVALKGPATTNSNNPVTVTLPKASIDLSSAGSDGQFLKTDGAGTLSFATVSSGMPTTGGTFTGDVTFDNQVNAGVDVMWDESANAVHFQDGAKANFGASSDMSIQHVSGNSVIQHNSGAAGDLLIRNRSVAGNGNIYIEAGTGTDNQSESSIVCMGTGQRKTKFYYQGSEVFSSGASGIEFPSAKGVTFKNLAASSVTGVSNTDNDEILNCYEFGKWTPYDGSGTAMGSANGIYVKMGHLVWCTADMTFGSRSGGSTVTIYGLPFTIGSGAIGGGYLKYSNVSSGGWTSSFPLIHMNPGNASLHFPGCTRDNTSGKRIDFSFTFLTKSF